MINPFTHGKEMSTVSTSASKAIHSAVQCLYYYLKNHRSLILSSAFTGVSDMTNLGMCVPTCLMSPSIDVVWGSRIAETLSISLNSPEESSSQSWHWLFVQKDSRTDLTSRNPVFKSHPLHPALVGSATS